LATRKNASRMRIRRDRLHSATPKKRPVEKATDSEPVKGEELPESEDLKRKLREDPAKKACPANFQFIYVV
jgi:hypothetical protein